MIDEGVTKFTHSWHKQSVHFDNSVDDLIHWRHKLFVADLLGHDARHNVDFGNISIRDNKPDHFIITGTQTGHHEDFSRDHLSLVTSWSLEDNSLCSEGLVAASSESLSHAALYASSIDVLAVVHTHSTPVWQQLKDNIPTTSQTIAYGTPAMAFELQRLLKESDLMQTGTAAMGGHEGGLISIGKNIGEAAARALAIAS
ncbi:MAG: class II aldolase/adducin family protein [Gammaproteobacteria bacterium]